jgi:hypothetical protein
MFQDAYWLSTLALAYAGDGNNAARAMAEQAIGVAQEQGTVRFEIETQLALARVLLATGGADDRHAIDAALSAPRCAQTNPGRRPTCR